MGEVGVKKVIIEFGRVYEAHALGWEDELVKYIPIAETPKAIGILRLRKKKNRRVPEKAVIADMDGFWFINPDPTFWLPKSQCKIDVDKAVVPQWLAKKYGLDLVVSKESEV